MSAKTAMIHPRCDLRGAVLLLAAVVALWISAASAPAPAQTPAILLDAKSATGESLLTINENGDLWIKGEIIEYAYLGLITLDPAKQHWAIRNADGDVLWALELTGSTAGNLHTACTFESNCFQVEQAGALFTAKTASGEAVFSMSADGATKAKGDNLTQTTPRSPKPKPPWPDMTSEDPPPAFLPETPPDSFSVGVTSKPDAQGRFYYLPFLGSESAPDSDVTDIPWRQRWVPSYDSLLDYGVCPGFRCQSIWQWPADWEYYPVYFWSPILEGDWEVGLTGGGQRYWKHYSFWIPDILDDNWNIYFDTDLAADQPLAPLDLSASMTNNPDPVYGTAIQDPPTSAKSRLFLYSGTFKHPDPGSIPRKAGDRSVNVFFQLVPEDMPSTWTNHIELTLWDPAYPNQGHKLIISGPSGQAWISTMWDGKLYENGVSGTAYYTQASDFFMQATVYWNQSTPAKPWEGGADEFQEPRYAIVASDGMQPVSSSPTNFAWISAAPAMPALSARLVANGGAQLPDTAQWSMTILFPRGDKKKPQPDADSYSAPSNEGVVWENMRAVMSGALRGGNVYLFCSFGGANLQHNFDVRGYNPDDASVLTTISLVNENTYGGLHWYAAAIAKHESHLGTGINYNQFYPQGWQGNQPDINPHQLDRPGNPVHHHDGDDSEPRTIGYGIMQITDPPATAEQIWNWKANINQGFVIMEDSRTAAYDHLDDLTGTEPTSMTIAGVWIGKSEAGPTCKDLDAIQKFNAGPYSHFFVSDTPGDGDLYWNVNVLLRCPATEPRWRNGTSTPDLNLWAYPERVLGQPD